MINILFNLTGSLFAIAFLALIGATATASDSGSRPDIRAAGYSNCNFYSGTLTPFQTRNAYSTEFIKARGRDAAGMAWVWRENPNVESNHTVSFAESPNLIDWFDSCGNQLVLPISLHRGEVVDAIPTGSGLLNNVLLSYDLEGRPVVTYMKYVYGPQGTRTTQIFNARRESSGWSIYQMTNWSTAWVLQGPGSIPFTGYQVGYGPIEVTDDGKMVQRFSRAPADSTGLPVSGRYVIGDNSAGELQILSTYAAPPPPPQGDFEWTAPAASAAHVLDQRPYNFATSFEVRIQPSRYAQSWLPIRGDWDGDGVNDPGLFDATRGNMHRWFQGAHHMESWGNTIGDAQLLPIVLRQFGGGADAFGVYSQEHDYWLAQYPNQMMLLGLGRPGAPEMLKDARWIWHDWNPGKRFFIRWETLPRNRDYPYDCNGNPLGSLSQSQQIIATCPEKFLSELTLWEYQRNTGQWVSSHIDIAWGGGAARFDFLTFKNIQIVSYYNSDRRLVVATRTINGPWSKVVTSSVYGGWDAHNFITSEVDPRHFLHITGNMHDSPLVYFKSPGIHSANLGPAQMTSGEGQVTYPAFLYAPTGELFFRYRRGVSGNGQWYLNRYNLLNGTWQQAMPGPLLSNH